MPDRINKNISCNYCGKKLIVPLNCTVIPFHKRNEDSEECSGVGFPIIVNDKKKPIVHINKTNKKDSLN